MKLIENIVFGVVKNGCGHSGHRTLKLPLSQEGINGRNGFLNAGTNSGKPKVALIFIEWVWSKMGVTLQNLLYLKSELMIWDDFFHADTNSRKLKITLNYYYWVAEVKNTCGFFGSIEL